jgi:hypothetical protein
MTKGRIGALVLSVALLAGTIAAPGASAGTEFGTTCAAGALHGSEGAAFTAVNTGKTPGSDGLALAAPASGVLTEWKLAIAFDTSGNPKFANDPKTLKVLRATGVPKQLRVVGESGPEKAGTGLSVFKTRIPVQAGDLIGIAVDYVPYCSQLLAGDFYGQSEGALLYQGGVGDFSTEENSNLVPLRAVLEPDADGDGFGDETQDKCLGNAAVQTDCAARPTVLDLFAFAKKRSIQVLVAASAEGPVKVSGKGLVSSTRVVGPGRLGRFTLRFTKSLKASLAKLPSGKSKKLTVQASAAGATVPQKAKVVVRGWDVGKKAPTK